MTAEPHTPWMDRLPARTRWILFLAILCCPFATAVIAGVTGTHQMLPRNGFQFARFVAVEATSWTIVFLVAFRVAGVTRGQLRLASRHPLRTLGFGILWFVAVRAAVILVFLIAFRWINPRLLWSSSDQMASFIDAEHIPRHPGFSCLVFGTASLIAGITEELWRAGMLAGLAGLFPSIGRKGPAALAAIVAVAVMFGFGHLYQGWFGVGNGMLLGFFLGLILVYRNSYWEAAIAHTLCDMLAFGLALFMALHPQALGAQIVYSAAQGDLPRVEHCVAMGANVNATSDTPGDWKGLTALEYAAQQPRPDMVRFLLEKGADPNLHDSHGRTPLIAASEQDQWANIRLLIAHGAALNWQDEKGFTALRAAAEYNHVEAARLLLAAGADTTLADHDGLTPLAAARKWNYSNMITLLQPQGAKAPAP